LKAIAKASPGITANHTEKRLKYRVIFQNHQSPIINHHSIPLCSPILFPHSPIIPLLAGVFTII
jgi:hypothetical protein